MQNSSNIIFYENLLFGENYVKEKVVSVFAHTATRFCAYNFGTTRMDSKYRHKQQLNVNVNKRCVTAFKPIGLRIYYIDRRKRNKQAVLGISNTFIPSFGRYRLRNIFNSNQRKNSKKENFRCQRKAGAPSFKA